MAQSHTTHPAASEPRQLLDSDIYISVAGYIGIIPSPSFPEGSTPSQRVAIREGIKQLALRKMQPIAKRAEADGKDVRAAVQTALDTYEPDPNQDFQTVGGRGKEIAAELLTAALKAAGKPSDEATVNKNLGAFMAHPTHGPKVAAALADWLTAYTPPTKRGTSGATGMGADLDLDTL